MKLLKYITSYLPFIILFILFCLNIFIMWPGNLTPDSHAQYHAALTGIYNDHHPPMMSLLWGILDTIHKGPGLLMIFHLALLYGAAAIFIAIFFSSRLKWLYVFFPWLPNIFFYSGMIWKDVGFAFTYLLVCAILSYAIMNHRPVRLPTALSVILLLFYGTLVKFQAIFVLPIPILGLMYCLSNYRFTIRTIIYSGMTYLAFIFAETLFNNYFVPEQYKSHSWQYVKLYDLAAMSIQKNEPLFPEFIFAYPDYSFERMKEKFNYERVDDIAFLTGAPLRKGATSDERNALFNCWLSTVMKHPWLYLKHRFINWYTIVRGMPLKKLETLSLQDLPVLSKLAPTDDTSDSSIKTMLGNLLLNLLRFIRHLLSFMILLPLAIAYFFLGLFYVKRNRAAMPLIIMNGIGLAMVVTLFFFSMASSLRYVYITICLVHASHAFAYLCLKDVFRKTQSIKHLQTDQHHSMFQ